MEEEKPIKHVVHTYEDDLSKAMDTTDASVVQELLSEGREREAIEKETKIRTKQKSWYSTCSIILIILTLFAIVYGVYHYKRLTVQVQKSATVGVFPSTKAIVSRELDIRTTIKTLVENTELEDGKPYLVPIVEEANNPTLLNPSMLFSFFESGVSEPFISSFNLVRLGIISTGNSHVPFIIGSTKDSEISSKEFLIAEPSLLKNLYKALGVDIGNYEQEIGKTFVSEYLYNIPVRSLRYDSKEEKAKLIFFYARVTDDIVVFTTSPGALKAIYDSLIRQRV